MTEETTPAVPALTAEQQAATEQLERIYSDRSHAYNAPGHPRYDAAAAEVLGLRRIVLGARKEDGGASPPASGLPEAIPPPTDGPISQMFSREDVARCLPQHWAPPETRRYVAAALDGVGLTPFEAVQFSNLVTSTPLPEAAFDPVTLWGAEAVTHARLVDGLLTKLSDDDYAEIEPYVLRVPAVANFILGVATRRAQGGR
jgi:hypothetical protein